MTDAQRQILGELPKTSHGQALQLFLDEEYKKIESVKGCKSFDETLGRQYALKVLDDLFGFMKGQNPNKPNKNIYE